MDADTIIMPTPTPTQITKGRRMLEHLNPESRDWFIAATDPFHDFERPLAGLPDQFVGRTVVECVTKQFSIQKPSDIIGLWDAHFFNTPFSEGIMDVASLTNSGYSTAIPYNIDGITVQDVPVGPVMWTLCGTGSPSIIGALGVATHASDYSDGYKSEAVRLIALGFEVTNTTADLARQGTVTVYKQPQVKKNVDLYHSASWNTNIQMFNMPPTYVGQAFSIPGSKTWKAADGVYIPCLLQTNNAEFKHDTISRQAMTQQSLLYKGSPFTPIYFNKACRGNYPAITLGGNHNNAFDNSGAYFTGLSETTTLTLTVKYYLELAPNATSPFLYLSTPSPIYDPRVFELYDETMSRMPPGVRKGDNDAGDFFKSLLGAVANAVMPGASLVTDLAVNSISKAVKNRREKKKEKAKNEPPITKGKPVSVSTKKKN